MSYVYKRPDGELYKISARKWNKAGFSGKISRFTVAHVYLRDSSASIEFMPSRLGILLFILLLPITYIISVLRCGMPETHREIKRALFVKKYGSFGTTFIYKKSACSIWEGLLALLKIKEI